ncbi:MAG TPA: ATP-binding protein [Chloroflexota bacterium]|nr:ATP-binding protein [Chloroflexota bacterium]
MSTNISSGYPDASFAPLANGNDRATHAHSVQFYDDDSFLLNELSLFMGGALTMGDVGVVIATRAHREALAQRLRARNLDIGLAVKQGRYIVLDAAETLSKLMREGWPDAARFADLMGGLMARATTAAPGERPRIAVFGEMVALLWVEGKSEAAIRLEQLWNNLARTHSFSLHCAYPMSLFRRTDAAESLGAICTAHSHVIPTEGYTSLVTKEDRLREITLLQQKALALETEIEERKRVEQALHERNQELREAVAARDVFMSVAAHELKTPITSLHIFAQLLLRAARSKREIAPERLEAALDTIELQTEKLSQLVTHLLDTAQIESGKLRIEPMSTDLVALTHAVAARQHRDVNHTVVFEGPERIEALVDPVRFEQVITNLLDNAIKFSPEGGVVTVNLEQGDDGGIRLAVTDQGVGIPPNQHEAVFGRFHQAHDEGHLSGMGLGLYITREIVELHGGRVWIEDPKHAGSRFVVTLPSSAALGQARRSA